MHTAEAAAAPTAAPAAPGPFWQFLLKMFGPSSLAPCSLFQKEPSRAEPLKRSGAMNKITAGGGAVTFDTPFTYFEIEY